MRSCGARSSARRCGPAFVTLDPAQQRAARTLFLRLSDEDAGGVIVRRRIALSDQDPGVVAVLTERRLLTVSEGTVEVAHEALLHEWPRLRGWLDEDRPGAPGPPPAARGRRGVGRRARRPLSRRPPGRCARLGGRARRRARADGRGLPGEAGGRASGRAHRRLQAGLAGVASLLVLALIAGLVALDQRNEAREREIDADAQRLGAQALASNDFDLGVLLARQGLALHDTVQARGNLLAALLKNPAAVGVIRGVGEPISVVLSHDGRRFATTSVDRRLRVVDARRQPSARTGASPRPPAATTARAR